MKQQKNKLAKILFAATLAAASGNAIAKNIDEALHDAKAYMVANEYNAAISELKSAAKLSPDNGELHVLLGTAYLAVNNVLAAEEQLIAARELEQPWDLWALPLARAYLMSGKYQQLIDEITIESNNKVSSNVLEQLYLLRGHALLAQKKLKESQQEYQQVLDINRGNLDATFGLARVAARDNEIKVAEKIVDRILKADPNYSDAIALKAELKRRTGDVAAAEAIFKQAIAVNSNNYSARLGLASLSLARKDFAMFEENAEYLYKVAPNHPKVSYFYALAKLRQGNSKVAQSTLEKAVKLKVVEPHSWLLLGKISYANGEFDNAATYLSNFIEVEPDNIAAVKLYAAAMLRSEDSAAAIAAMERVDNYNLHDYQLLLLLGNSYINDMQYNKGMQKLEQAAKLAPDVAAIKTSLALGYIGEGKYQLASVELNKAISLKDDALQTDALLFLSYVKIKNLNQIIEAANQVLEKKSDSPWAHNIVGLSYAAKGDFSEAEDAFEKAIKQAPDFATAKINLAELYFRNGKSKKSEKLLKEYIATDSGNVRANLLLALILQNKGEFADAEGLIFTAEKANPNLSEPGIRLARLYLAENKLQQALVTAEKLADKFSDDVRVQQLYGGLLVLMENYQQAIAPFEKIVKLEPNSFAARVFLAKVYMKSDNLTAAEAAVSAALSIKANYIPALLVQADIAVKGKKYSQALEIAEVVKKHYPQTSLGDKLEGDIYATKGIFDKALLAYQRAYSIEKTAATAWAIYEASNNIAWNDNNIKILLEWLDENPNDSTMRQLVATEYMEHGKDELAIAQYQRILDDFPDEVISLNNLAALYVDKDPNKALAYAEKAYKLAPDSAAVNDTYGWVLVKNNAAAKALPFLQMAAKNSPDDKEIQYHLAAANYKIGNNNEAKEILSALLKEKQDFPSLGEVKILHQELIANK